MFHSIDLKKNRRNRDLIEDVDEDEDDDGEVEVEDGKANGELGDSDDEYDDDAANYVEGLDDFFLSGTNFTHEFDEWFDDYTTEIDHEDLDEFISFKDTCEAVQSQNQQLFAHITQKLSDEQKADVQNIINEGVRRQKQKESLHLSATGGYKFTVQEVPKNFSFGGSLSG